MKPTFELPLRQPLAHAYDTKIIKAGRLECGIYVGWALTDT